MNGYICFYNSKRVEIYAETMFEARDKAAKTLKVKDKFAYRISVNLAEVDVDGPTARAVVQSTN